VNIDSFEILNAINAIKGVGKCLSQEKCISPAMNAAIKVSLPVIKLMGNRLGFNSANSSKPASSDQNRDNDNSSNNDSDDKNKRKPGGQRGDTGTTLKSAENPDKVDKIIIDKRSLPANNYHEAGYEIRQTVDIKTSRFVTEYREHVLKNENGEYFVAAFPKGLTRPI
jgi:transposase